jgi:putative acetyltransferase
MIRPEEPRDLDAIRAVHLAAFGQSAEADLVDALRPGTVSLVAEIDGAVVGHVLFSPVEVGGSPALALAPMGVLPAFQRRGIGSELVRRGLDAGARLGHGVVIVLGHAEYYPRFGFRPARPHGIVPPWDVPDEVFLARELAPGALEKMRGRVVYPPPFDRV